MFERRTYILAVVFSMGVFILLGRLGQLQLLESEKYRQDGRERRHRLVQVPPIRGRILDANGVVLAEDVPSYDIWLTPARYARQGRAREVVGLLGDLQPVNIVNIKNSPAAERKTLEQSALLSLLHGSPLVFHLARILKRPREEVAKTILRGSLYRHANFPEALTIPRRCFRNIPKEAYLALEQAKLDPLRKDTLAALDLRVGARRHYPYGAVMGHITGYTGSITNREYRRLRGYWKNGEIVKGTGRLTYREQVILRLDPDSDEARILAPRKFYRHGLMRYFAGFYSTETIGRSGVELYYNERLRGRHRLRPLRLERPDPNGPRRFVGSDKKLKRTVGADIRLTLDVKFQEKFVAILQEKMAELTRKHPNYLDPKKDGSSFQCSALLMNPQNGRIIAMASLPGLDPNTFRKNYATISKNKNFSLTSRVISGEYPPGSVLKPIVGLQALYIGAIKKDTAFVCRGYIELKNSHTGRTKQFVCMRKVAHGTVVIRRGLMKSCNVFFYHVGESLGSRELYQGLKKLGLGRPTGIDLSGEAGGKIPLAAFTRKGWSLGQTYHLAIGQGAITVTPLQIGVAFAAIANGGYLVRPHVLLDDSDPTLDQPRGQVDVTSEALDAVRQGMLAVVQDDEGTGRRARIPGIKIAGKTGSAQWRSGLSRNTHAWFACYAPFDNPQVVCVVLVPKGGGGGGTCAPIAKALLELYFGIVKAEEGTVG